MTATTVAVITRCRKCLEPFVADPRKCGALCDRCAGAAGSEVWFSRGRVSIVKPMLRFPESVPR